MPGPLKSRTAPSAHLRLAIPHDAGTNRHITLDSAVCLFDSHWCGWVQRTDESLLLSNQACRACAGKPVWPEGRTWPDDSLVAIGTRVVQSLWDICYCSLPRSRVRCGATCARSSPDSPLLFIPWHDPLVVAVDPKRHSCSSVVQTLEYSCRDLFPRIACHGLRILLSSPSSNISLSG